MSVILNVAFVGARIAGLAGFPHSGGLASCVVISVKTQFPDHAKVKDTSKLIKGMSKVHQKLLKYFNGTTISRLFLVFMFSSSVPLFAFDVFPVVLLLSLKDLELVIGSAL